MSHFHLYGTLGCHLCEEAEQLLNRWEVDNPGQIELTHIDIADDASMMERYGLRIPVIKDHQSGAELGWPFDEERLAEFLMDCRDKPKSERFY